jgi:acetolactate synthase I/II/III large subunit
LHPIGRWSSMMNVAASGSEILLDALRRQGVEVVFGIPGGTVLPLYDALHRDGSGLRHILVRHEQAAAFAADGYARATGKAGVCLATSGPGATNLVTGLTSSLMDSIPVVALTGQVPSALLGKDAFQEADTIGITLPSTKQSFAVKSAAEIPATIERAFCTASSGRPGPVLVDLPKSVLLEKAEPRRSPSSGGNGKPSTQTSFREWAADDLARAAELILASRHPVLYIGGGVIAAGAAAEVRELADLLQIPVTTTLMALGAFPSRHPLSLGMLGMHGSFATNTAVCECDLLIAIGARFDDRVTGRVSQFASRACKIQIDIDPSEVNKNVPVDVALVGDARETLRALLDALRAREQRAPQREREAWLKRIDAWRAQHPLAYDRYSPEVKPQFVIETLSRYAADDAIVAVDVGQHQMWTAQFFSFKQPRTWLSSSGLGAMGYGFPAAMGAQAAFPDRQVIAVVGDGGFQMTLNDLATVAQYQLPVKIAVLNNRSLGMVRQWQELFFEKRYSHIDLTFAPDFTKLAESYGIRGARVEHRTDVADAVEDFLDDREPRLIEFCVDPDENVYPIVPPGAALAEMVVEPRRARVVEEQTVEDLWAV